MKYHEAPNSLHQNRITSSGIFFFLKLFGLACFGVIFSWWVNHCTKGYLCLSTGIPEPRNGAMSSCKDGYKWGEMGGALYKWPEINAFPWVL